jgi:hypothetical protein
MTRRPRSPKVTSGGSDFAVGSTVFVFDPPLISYLAARRLGIVVMTRDQRTGSPVLPPKVTRAKVVATCQVDLGPHFTCARIDPGNNSVVFEPEAAVFARLNTGRRVCRHREEVFRDFSAAERGIQAAVERELLIP